MRNSVKISSYFHLHVCVCQSKQVNQYVTRQLTDVYNTHSEVWLGLSDVITEGDFRWTDNSTVTYHNWGFAEGHHLKVGV